MNNRVDGIRMSFSLLLFLKFIFINHLTKQLIMIEKHKTSHTAIYWVVTFFSLLCFNISYTQAQTVYIPDSELADCLQTLNGSYPGLIDAGNNVDVIIAATVDYINCPGDINGEIQDLTGIDVFTGLEQLYIQNNCIEDVSLVPSALLTDFLCLGNKLTFEDLQPFTFMGLGFTYALQDSITITPDTVYLCSGYHTIDMGIDPNISPVNTYNWYKDGAFYRTTSTSVSNPTGSIDVTDAGTYTVNATNPQLSGLTLYGTPVVVITPPALTDPVSVISNEPAEVYQCGTNTFTVEIINNTANETFTNVTMDVVLPAGVSYIANSVTGAMDDASLTTTAPIFTIPDISPNGTTTLTYDAFISCGTGGTGTLEHQHHVEFKVDSCTYQGGDTTEVYTIADENLFLDKVFEHLPDYLNDGDTYCMGIEVVGNALEKADSELEIVIDYGCALDFNLATDAVSLDYIDENGAVISPTNIDNNTPETLKVTYTLPINGDIIAIAPKFTAVHCTNNCPSLFGFVKNEVGATASVNTTTASACGAGCPIASTNGFKRNVFHAPCSCPSGTCTGGACNGIRTDSYQFTRISDIGEADNDEDRCADGNGTATFPPANPNKVMEGDMMEGVYEGTVNLPTLNTVPFAYISTFIDNGNLITTQQIQIDINGGAYVTTIPAATFSANNIAETNLTGPDDYYKLIEYDISAGSPVGNLLGLPPNFVYTDGDQITITTTYDITSNIGATTIDLTGVPLHYVGNSANPPTNDRYFCFTDNLCNTELMGTDTTAWETQVSITNCGELHCCSQEFYVGRPYYEYDAFEKEYRAWRTDVNKTINIPAGYDYLPGSASLEIHNGQNINNNLIEPIVRIKPAQPTVGGGTLTFNEPLYQSGGAPNCDTNIPDGLDLALADAMSADDGFKAVLKYELVESSEVVTANFTYDGEGKVVDFTYSGSTNATTYSWDFGDTNTSTQKNPTHTYANFGTYNVCLVAQNACTTDTLCQIIEVEPQYIIESDTIVCGSTDTICIWISTLDVLPSGIAGIDYCLTFDPNILTATNQWELGPVVTNGLVGSDSPFVSPIPLPGGTLISTVSYTGSPATSELTGSGRIICHKFVLQSGLSEGVYPIVECDSELEEDYYSGPNQYVPVEPGNLVVIEDNSFDGKLIYWETNRPIINVSNTPSITIPRTEIWEVDANCNPDTPPSLLTEAVDTLGCFEMEMNVSCGYIKIRRDISNANDLSTVIDPFEPEHPLYINGSDAFTAQMINAGQLIPSIWQLIAADVTNDGFVGPNDYPEIVERGAGNRPQFLDDSGNPIPDWRFLNAATLTDPNFITTTDSPSGNADDDNVPTVFPECFPLTVTTDVNGCTVCQAETFHGILMGDVNGSWTPDDANIARLAVPDSIIFDLTEAITTSSGSFIVPVSYSIAGNVLTSMDFLMDHDERVLQIGNITTDPALSSSPLYMSWKNHAGDKVRLSSAVFDLNGLTHPDPNPIYYLSIASNTNNIQPSDFGDVIGQLNGFEAEIVFRYTPPAKVHPKLYLEGAFDAATGQMSTDLATTGLLTLCDNYDRLPWKYLGTNAECINNLPANAVDWIMLEARDATDNNIVLETRAAILLNDGSVMDIDGTMGVTFYTLANNQPFYLAVRHRSHLAVMSNTTIALSGFTANYDFTTAATQALGTQQLTALSNGIYALYAGDINSDGVINVADFNLYNDQLSSIGSNYDGDLNLDGTVSTGDFNKYRVNASKIGIRQLRY